MTKKNIEKNLKYYSNLPWKFEYEKAPEGGFYAKVKGLACHSHGDNMEEAYQNIQDALECHLESSIENNIPIAEPISEIDCNGRLSFRTTKSMHCKLVELAKDEDVSVSHLINDAVNKMYG